jgi:two-component system response regulator AtoC
VQPALGSWTGIMADTPTRFRSLDALPADDGALERVYLLVIDDGSCQRHTLPAQGTLVLGSAPDTDIHVRDPGIAGHHVRLRIADGEVWLVDLGSDGGTLVNCERVHGTRRLCSGDVVTLGSTTLVLLREPRPGKRPVLHAHGLRQRLEEELDRAIAYARPLGVAVLCPARLDEREHLGAAAAAVLRRMDVLGWDGATRLVAVLPEVGGEAARAMAQELVTALAPVAGEVHGGLATCPGDGCHAETLLSGAHAAAAIAEPGEIALAAETTVEYSIAGHVVAAAEPAMLRVFDLLRRLAACDLPVLVLGETGTGKEHAAAALHDWSARRERRLVCINCAAIPETLIESELFGYERGAFSDARSPKLGLLEQASGGTVFLDEVAELGPGAQAKLLRALDTKRITHLGDVRERALDIRIVAATNRDLEAESRAGRFRQDLLFRLGAAVVVLPPLRHRLRELPILSRLFVAEACARAGRPGLEISESTLYQLAAYGWPGNVRELRNALEFAVATAEGATIEPWHLPDRISGRTAAASPEAITTAAAATSVAPRRYRPIAEELRELERTRMQEALEDAGGVQTRAAELIGMPIRTFALKLKQYGISARDVKRRQE